VNKSYTEFSKYQLDDQEKVTITKEQYEKFKNYLGE